MHDNAPLTAAIAHHARAMLRLSLPIIFARAGWMFMSMVDVLMVGRYATDELAYMSLATSAISVAYVTMMGMMLGTLVVSSNLFGQLRYSEIGAVWRRSLPYAVLLGVLILALSAHAEPMLLACGQDPTVARESARLMLVYGYGMPLGGLVYVTSQYFLEGIKRPVPAMLLMLGGNLVNAALNWILIYGHLGFEPLGAEGSAWATTIVRSLLTAGIIAYIWTMPGARRLGVRRRYSGGFAAWAEQRRIGYAAGASFGIEHVSFVILFLFAGILGTRDLAAVTIVFNTFAMFFMVGTGIASATAVQVGIAWGQRSARNMALAGWTGWGLMCVLLLGPALVMVLAPGVFAGLYTRDTALIELALPMYVLAGFALLLDTTQTVWANALRAQHDKWFPTVSHLVSYLGVMVPLAWYFAFPLGHRGAGLFESLILASVVSVALLTTRFVCLARRGAPRLAGAAAG
ncbi:MAG: MATE family efflux transporter [Gammaproteobacteria bacterium]